METAIQNATNHFRNFDCNVDDDQISFPSYSVESILLKFGNDAFEPNVLNSKESSSQLVPKIRLHFSNKEWFGLDFSYRLFILKAFYNNL